MQLTNIQYRSGDLLASPLKYICHGCNAQGVMRSGIAKTIRELYPQAYSDYHAKYVKQGNMLELGQVVVTETPDRVIFNMITQEYYGRDPNHVYVSYEAIRIGILVLNMYAACKNIGAIGFPMIGAGLANGDWDRISHIIESTAAFEPIVYRL